MCTRFAPTSDKAYQLLACGRWFSLGIPASSITKTCRHDIAEILLKVALSTINQIKSTTKHTTLYRGSCQNRFPVFWWFQYFYFFNNIKNFVALLNYVMLIHGMININRRRSFKCWIVWCSKYLPSLYFNRRLLLEWIL